MTAPGELEPEDRALDAQLHETWKSEPGLIGWLKSVDHKSIGLRFIITAFIFFILGGVQALLMRLQLSSADSTLLGPDFYDVLFSVHGSTMMFLFAVPIMEGLGIYFVPLLIGARNTAFPRLAAFAYYTYLIGGVLLYVGLFTNTGPDAGWFATANLSGPAHAAGKRIDFWAQMITFTEISAIAGAVNSICTIFTLRAPGMSIGRIPLFVWTQLVTAFMVLFAMPAIVMASGLLALDRLVGTHFFNPVEGGDPLLYQHLFWFFGHPEVYIIFLPATGLVSTILPAFTRRPIFGYTAMVLSIVAIGFLAFGLWVHHMFATGLPQLGSSFFTAASMMVALPSGIQIFCWLATIATGRLVMSPPLLFVLGFFAIFVLGGLTGVSLAAVPLNIQLHDTFYVVAHFHYVLIGGAVFPLLGAMYFWFPKLSGRMLDDRLGYWSCGLAFVGFNLTFFPMHLLGMYGMPRRVFTYAAETGWEDLNRLATVGAAILALGVVTFAANVAIALVRGRAAGRDPWCADTLEWATASPPPSYGFLHLPLARSRSPNWEEHPRGEIIGIASDRKEALITNVVDSAPDHRVILPSATIWPFFAALAAGVAFIVSIFTPWGLPLGLVLAIPAGVGWFWPDDQPRDHWGEST